MSAPTYPTPEEWRQHDQVWADTCKILKCDKAGVLPKIKKIQDHIESMKRSIVKLGGIKTVATYSQKDKMLTLVYDGETVSLEFQEQEQARKWMDDNGYRKNGLNLWLDK